MSASPEAVYTRACATSEVSEDGVVAVEIGGCPVAIARSGGRYYAIHDVCSHGQVTLSEGEVEDGLIECWMHGSRFDLETGEPISLPATEPVPVYPVRIDGDSVLVAVPSAGGAGVQES